MKTALFKQMKYLLLGIFAVNFLVLIAFPIVFSHVTYPAIISLVQGRIEERAVRASAVLNRLHLPEAERETGEISFILNTFNIPGLRLIDTTGLITFSTLSDSGKVSKDPLVKEILTKGETISAYVPEYNSENKSEVSQHRFKTFIPIVKEGEFTGFYEFEQNATKELGNSLRILHRARNFFVAFGIFMIIFLAYFTIRFLQWESSAICSDTSTSGEAYRYNPVKMITILLLSLFTTEVIVMLIMEQFQLPSLISALIDALAITAIVTPIFYNGIFKSLLRIIETLHKRDSELLQAKKDAEMANEAKGRFLANMTHELRTPMNAVLGMTHVLEHTELDNEQNECVETILSSGEVLLSVVNNVLDISKIENDKLILNKQLFDIRHTVDEVSHILVVIAHQKGIKLNVLIDHTISFSHLGDADRVKQILINLGNNAIKFTRSGTVQIKLSLEKAESNGETILFSIADTGVGITKEFKKIMFEPFAQADNSISRQYGGTGLGLPIAQSFVELMGGKISVSKDSYWSTIISFSLTLPVISHTANDLSLKGTRAILLTNDTLHHNSIEEYLRFFKVNVDVVVDFFTDSDTILSTLSSMKRPDILIIDIDTMCNACTTRSEVVESLNWSDVTAVFIQPTGCKINSDNCRHNQTAEYTILKPVRKTELFNLLCRVLLIPAPPNRSLPVVNKNITAKEKCIALVDDNYTNLKVGRKALEKLGYTILTYSCGEDILEEVGSEMPDLILMDIQMPIMNGIQTTKLLRAMISDDKIPAVPIFAMTAAVIDVENSPEYEELFDGVISKPFNIHKLGKTLETALQ